MGLCTGTVIAGRYRLEQPLGQGGMGSVWQASHLVTGRSVALKVMRSRLSERVDMRRRFLREARAAASVQHANVVDVFDVFELDDGTPVMVMALLRGETYGQRLARERRLSIGDASDVILPVISAAGAAHALGIIHRDLKPDNVFLCRESDRVVVKVLDFGIAKFTVEENGTDADTSTGTMLGTPSYMAPEQGFGEKDLDHRVDVWAIGAMLYESLSGRRPIEGDNLGQVLKQFMMGTIAPIETIVPSLPADLSRLITHMLVYAKHDRLFDLGEAHVVLSRYAQSPSPGFDPPSRRIASLIADGTTTPVATDATGPELDRAPSSEAPATPTMCAVPVVARRQATAPHRTRGAGLRHVLLGGMVLAAGLALWRAVAWPPGATRPATATQFSRELEPPVVHPPVASSSVDNEPRVRPPPPAAPIASDPPKKEREAVRGRSGWHPKRPASSPPPSSGPPEKPRVITIDTASPYQTPADP